MMSDPIELQILESMQTALRGIRSTDGYHNTVHPDAVKLDANHDVEALIGPEGLRPIIVLEFSSSEVERYYKPLQMIAVLPVTVHAVGDSDPTLDNGHIAAAERLLADVEQALAEDNTRGGLVSSTRMTGKRIRAATGRRAWVEIDYELRTHRRYGAPNG